jgi:hypothetical protein
MTSFLKFLQSEYTALNAFIEEFDKSESSLEEMNVQMKIDTYVFRFPQLKESLNKLMS